MLPATLSSCCLSNAVSPVRRALTVCSPVVLYTSATAALHSSPYCLLIVHLCTTSAAAALRVAATLGQTFLVKIIYPDVTLWFCS